MLMVPAHTRRYRRFADALTGAHARLAEKRGWLVLSFQRTFTAYLVPVSLAHSRRSRRLPSRVSFESSPVGTPGMHSGPAQEIRLFSR